MNHELYENVTLLVEAIKQSDKEHFGVTFRDTPNLRKIVLYLQMNQSQGQDTLRFCYDSYNFVALMFDRMGRVSVAAFYYVRALEIVKKLKRTPRNLDSIIRNALIARNYYVDDDCQDIRILVKGRISEKKLNDIYKKNLNQPRELLHDPVEMSDAYLSVIDEVEEILDEQFEGREGRGLCHALWKAKKSLLIARGVSWKSLGEMNPHIRFD